MQNIIAYKYVNDESVDTTKFIFDVLVTLQNINNCIPLLNYFVIMSGKDKEEFRNAVREVAHLSVRLESPYGKHYVNTF